MSAGEPRGGALPSEAEAAEEYLARALERAQALARARGFIRTALPSWGLEATRPSLGSLVGTSESAALDLGAGDEGGAGDVEEGSGESPGAGVDPIAEAREALKGAGDAEGDLLALERARIRARSKWAKSPGMAAMHLKFRPAGRLDALLAQMIRTKDWDTPTKMGSIMAKWPQIVGPDVAEHSEIEAFEERTLIVRCSSTAWAKQLHLLLQMIERRIDEEVGAGVVEKVIIRGPVAPSWRKGPLSVRGRGPRDTYG